MDVKNYAVFIKYETFFQYWVIMADPARVKPEDNAEKVVSINEEQGNIKSDETEDISVPVKSTDENKDSSSQDKDKEEPKNVSCTTSTCFCPRKV